MKSQPDISIIVPVYNGASTIAASVGSLLQQSLSSIEIVLVNDASSDRSAEAIEELAREDDRIRTIHCPKNLGVHEARALGIQNSSSPWVGFLDADDFARNDMFEKLLRAGTEHQADLVICGSKLVTEQREFIRDKVRFEQSKTLSSGAFNAFCRFELGTGALWNKLYRRELIEDVAMRAFPWRQDASEDTIVNIGCFLKAERVHLLAEPLHEYVVNRQSATQTANPAKSYCRILQGYAIALDLYQSESKSTLEQITKLYTKQLGFSPYIVGEIKDLDEFEAEFRRAFELIFKIYPIGLAFIANKKVETKTENLGSDLRDWKNATRKVVKRLLKRA